MRNQVAGARRRTVALRIVAALGISLGANAAAAQTPNTASGSQNPSLEVYGFGMVDAIADFKQNNPDWYDVARPSKLPSSENQYGQDGHFYMSARQTRFGVKGLTPTSTGDVKGQFEFDLFGTGKDAGLTTIRFRHGWGQYKQIGGGQTNTQFMDIDVFPNTIEYWGPNGMMFVRNPQLFWEPIAKADGTNLRVAIENPGGSGDAGLVADRVAVQGVTARFPVPDFTGHYRMARSKGYVQAGGVFGYMAFDDNIPTDKVDLSDHVWRWGVNGSTNYKVTPNDVVRAQFTYGAGIANYFNDAPTDVGVEKNPGNTIQPVQPKALPIFGMIVALDHNWNEKLSSAIFYSRVDVTNGDAQAGSAYKNGQYMAFNLLLAPAKNVLYGGEFQWVNRSNFTDGFSVNDYRMQFSFKYSFSAKVGG